MKLLRIIRLDIKHYLSREPGSLFVVLLTLFCCFFALMCFTGVTGAVSQGASTAARVTALAVYPEESVTAAQVARLFEDAPLGPMNNAYMLMLGTSPENPNIFGWKGTAFTRIHALEPNKDFLTEEEIESEEDVLIMNSDMIAARRENIRENVNIIRGNALRMDWIEVCQHKHIDFVFGNPPFVGKKYQDKDQKSDMAFVFGNSFRGSGNLDYVTAWYMKAAACLEANTECAFVATNSIVQGEQVPILWKPLFELMGIKIEFAYRTFKWANEAKNVAGVHCVIIGFSKRISGKELVLYDNGKETIVNHINQYLIDAPDVFVENRSRPICNVPSMVYGSFALDDGNYTIPEQEYIDILNKEPHAERFMRPFIGSDEYINNVKRYCIWLKGIPPNEIKTSSIILKKVDAVRTWRLSSNRKETVAAANTPTIFAEIRQPLEDYLAVPITSSERRQYIPIGYLPSNVIASNHLLIIPGADFYCFGILTSSTHMNWMRVVAGRLKSDYNYSARIVYNNFPWPDSSDIQKVKISESAHAILSARALYPEWTLSEMYDPRFMPIELQRAHQDNDRAVWEAYGRAWPIGDEAACVAHLMKLYRDKCLSHE